MYEYVQSHAKPEMAVEEVKCARCGDVDTGAMVAESRNTLGKKPLYSNKGSGDLLFNPWTEADNE